MKWQKLGQTETIWNDLCPDFVKSFLINYFFEKSQILRFEVYDYNDVTPALMGYTEIALNKLLSSK